MCNKLKLIIGGRDSLEADLARALFTADNDLINELVTKLNNVSKSNKPILRLVEKKNNLRNS